MKRFLLALQSLTIIPVKIRDIRENKVSESLIYFPVVGLLLGGILTGTDRFLCFLNLAQFFINIILVLFLVLLTGGLHLDGLADTIDAFSSGKDREGILKIMRDSNVGVMGVLSLISIILLKIGFLSVLSTSSKTFSLLLMCILSRWALVLSIFLFPYARQEGKAKSFFQGVNIRIFVFSTIIMLSMVSLFWKVHVLLLILIVAGIAYIIGKITTDKIGGITGDTLGATNELIETSVLISMVILERVNLF